MFGLVASADVSRFDLHLLVMAIALASGLGVAAISAVSAVIGATSGSLVAWVALYDALVRRPPA